MGNNKLAKSIIGAFMTLAGVFIFNHSAYAASYLNVSSSGSVSFGSIRPTSSGTSSTGSDTLTVHTDCSTGYSVYVSGQNGKDTNLTNSSASSNNTISTSSNTIGSAGSLNSNTWGLNYENTGSYVGLPTYADATNTALTTKTSVEEESTVPIYYGIKVDTSITPGTYTGDVLYTVLMDSSCLAYTVVFDANGGSGEMANQSIMAGTKTALDENTFTRDGYTFLGWSTKANGKTETAVDGVGTEADVDYADKAEVTDLTSGGSSITLYAIWEQDVETMQGWTGCSALTTGQAVTLKDIRDNKRYAVKKLPDGKCWMVQNLALGMNATEVGLTLAPENTNIDNDTTYYLPPAGKQGSDAIDKSSTLTATTTANFSSSNDNRAKTQFRTKDSSITNDSDTGYYNFYTVTLGFSYRGDGISSGSSPRDVCPKGWRLPKTTDAGKTVSVITSANDFTYLARQYSTSGWQGTATSANYYIGDPSSAVHTGLHTGATANGNNYAGFSRAGNYDGASLDNLGSEGLYWSSSVYDAGSGYYLYFSSSQVYPQRYNTKYRGLATRCVAQDNYTIAYSSDGSDSGEASKTSETVFQNNGTVNVTMPTAGTLTKDGYEFKGWALTSGATTATYTAGQTVTLSTLLTAASSAGQPTTPGSTVTLYPVWGVPDDGNLGTMQDFVCNNLTSGHTATLTDSRDGQTYGVYRIPTDQTYAGTSTVANVAGKCIMTKDLNLGAVASVLGASSSITANGTMTLSPNDSGFTAPTGSGESITVPTSNVTVSAPSSWSGTNAYSNKQYKANGTGNYAGRGYYSWGAAMVVCPKGWRLPTADEYVIDSGSRESQTGGLAAIVKGSNVTTTISNITSSPYSFVLGGFYYGSFVNASSFGYYWSSTQASNTGSYRLDMGLSSGLLRGNYSKYDGATVRCVSNPVTYAYTLSYSGVNFATTNKPETQTYTGYEASHTFTLPSAKPTYSTTGTTLTFSNYTYNGTTYNPGDTITLSSSSPSATITANWTRSCTISTSTGCKLADNKTWIYGNSGNTVTWDNLCTGNENCKASTYCPSGYQNIPTRAVITSLRDTYGNNGALYQVLGLSGSRGFWSSTEDSSITSSTYFLGVNSSSVAVYGGYKANSLYVLCYKFS